MSHSVEILSLKTTTIGSFENAVYKINCRLTWTDNSGDASVSENFVFLLFDPLDTENIPDPSGFTSYETLQESTVISWVEADNAFQDLILSLSQRKPATSVENSPSLPW